MSDDNPYQSLDIGHTERKDREPSGLGGWLILVGIGLALSPLRLAAVTLATFLPLFRDGVWATLTTPGSEQYHPLLAALMIFELVGNLGFFVAYSVLVFLFFRKSRSFPRTYIAISIVNLCFVVLDSWLSTFVLPNEQVLDPEVVKEIARSLVSSAIWIPYMLVSKRVKNTFIEKSPIWLVQQSTEHSLSGNLYTQEFDAKPPQRKSHMLKWILCGLLFVFVSALLFVGRLLVVVGPRGAGGGGNNFGAFIEPSVEVDDSETIRFQKSNAAARLEQARIVFNSPGNSPDVTDEELRSIDEFLQKLKESLNSQDDARFESMLNMLEFRHRVRKSPALSETARRRFDTQFDEYNNLYLPMYGWFSDICVMGVRRDSNDSTLLAYTYLQGNGETERYVWYFQGNGSEVQLVDYEDLQSQLLRSDITAREFSAAFVRDRWDNYIECINTIKKFSEMTPDTRRAELRRLSQLKFPDSIAHLEYFQLASTARFYGEAEIMLDLLNRTESLASLPGIWWHRASHQFEQKKWIEADGLLQKYVDRVGPGPETLSLEAQIADARQQNERANAAWLQFLVIDPKAPGIAWDFHKNLSPVDVQRLVPVLSSRPNAATSAIRISQLFLDRARPDLVEPLLVLIESGKEPIPELLALRAAMARDGGDDKRYLELLKTAWQSAPADHPDRASWIYQWTAALNADGRGAEAILTTPDPGSAFNLIAYDDDDSLVLSARELEPLCTALQNAEASDEAAKTSLAAWQFLAPNLLRQLKHEDAEVWNELSSYYGSDANSPFAAVRKAVEEEGLESHVQDLLIKSSVATGHVAEAYELLPPENRLWTILYSIESSQEHVEALKVVVERARSDSPGTSELFYAEANLSAARGDDDATTLQAWLRFLNNPGAEESGYRYSAESAASNLVLKQSFPQPILSELPLAMLSGGLLNALLSQERFAEAEEVLRVAEQRGADSDELFHVRVSLLNARRDFDGLCSLCRKWLAGPVQSANETANSYRVHQHADSFVEAAVRTGDTNLAQKVIERMPENYRAENWRLQVAISAGNRADVERILEVSNDGNAAFSDAYALGPAASAFWSDDWQELRRRHPIYLYDISRFSPEGGSTLILMSNSELPTAAKVEDRLRAVVADLKLTDMTEEAEAIRASVVGRIQSSEIETHPVSVPSSERQTVLRAFFGDESVLIVMSTGSLFYNRKESVAEVEIPQYLSKDLQARCEAQKSWICLHAEANPQTFENPNSIAVLRKLTAAMLDENSLAIVQNSQIRDATEDVRLALADGRHPVGDSPYIWFPGFGERPEFVSNQIVRKRCRSLQKRLSGIDPATADVGIKVTVILPISQNPGTLLLDMPITSWWPRAFPTEFTVQTAEQLLIPPAMQGEPMTIQELQIVDWYESNSGQN